MRVSLNREMPEKWRGLRAWHVGRDHTVNTGSLLDHSKESSIRVARPESSSTWR
jgi:hypothetical protein